MVFRSLLLGLVAAIFMLLVRQREPQPVVYVHAPSSTPQAVHVIDVSAKMNPTLVPSLVPQLPGEHLISVNDAPVASDLDGVLAMQQAGGKPGVIDVMMRATDGRELRYVLLVH
ncbi:MAG TPA: hypothetical protein VLB44_04700 [Kofleriaceae bacterium]|nr:hypothetical protein [Kofleriaceae bacterium]